MKRRYVVMPVFVLFCFCAAVVSGRELKKDYHEQFDVKKGASLRLLHGDGDVEIESWDKDVLDVKVRYRLEYTSLGLGGSHEFDVDFEQRGNTIYITGRERSSGGIGIHSSRRYEYIYKIHAPRYLELDLKGDDGDIELNDWSGDIKCQEDDGDIYLGNITSRSTDLRLNDGDVYIEKLEGDLRIDSEDGDVVLTECQTPMCRVRLQDGDLKMRESEGDIEINSEDGDIRLQQVKALTLYVSTQDGDINLELLKEEKIDIDITSEDGDVVLDVEEGFSATFSLETDDGRIRLNIPDALIKERDEKSHKSGRINDGDGRIDIRTDDGDILLRQY